MSDQNQAVAAAPPVPATTASTSNPTPTAQGGALSRAAHWVEKQIGVVGEEVAPVAEAVVTPPPPAPAGSFQATVDGLVSSEIKALLGTIPVVAEIDAALAGLGLPSFETLLSNGAANAVAAVFDHLSGATDRKAAPAAIGGAK